MSVRVACFAVGALAAAPAHANTPPPPAVIATLAPGPDLRDAREAVAVGPAGQAYEPDKKGAWIRHHAGGIADDVVHAIRSGALVIAGVQAGPPYGWDPRAGAWSAIHLGLKAHAILGRGARATAAVGKTVFAFDAGKVTKLPDAPFPVAQVGASGKAVVIETDHGLWRLAGAKWKPIANAPAHVAVLLDDTWALVDRGVLALDSQKTTAWPAGFHVVTAVAVGADLVVACAVHNAAAELLTVRAGKLEHEVFAIDHPNAIVAVVADKAGRVVVAARDGQLAIRDRKTWTTATVGDQLPADRPGSPPAVSK